jgi:protein-S-isoprenylcysteine O-methyltransferase Ste14
MQRYLILLYGVFSYAVFLLSVLYAIGFVGNMLVPRSMDSAASASLLPSLLINIGLLFLFALQHSVMARPAFKRWWTRWVPVSAERSTYVLFSSVALLAVFAGWQPLGGVVWAVQQPIGVALLYGLYFGGWLLVLYSTFLISHSDLLGLRQVWLQFRRQPYTPLSFCTPRSWQRGASDTIAAWRTQSCLALRWQSCSARPDRSDPDRGCPSGRSEWPGPGAGRRAARSEAELSAVAALAGCAR